MIGNVSVLCFSVIDWQIGRLTFVHNILLVFLAKISMVAFSVC